MFSISKYKIDFTPEFKQIIYDHKAYIIKTSIKKILSESIRSIYQYRDIILLTKEFKYPKEILWIVKYINDIPQLEPLTSKKELYLPNIKLIEELYDLYIRSCSS